MWFDRDAGLRYGEPPGGMRVAMVLTAALCLGAGIAYAPLYALLPYPMQEQPYTTAHVVSQIESVAFAVLAFFVLLRWLRPARGVTLDVDWLYRVLLPRAGRELVRVWDGTRSSLANTVRAPLTQAGRSMHDLIAHPGPLARTWSSGATALWMLVLVLALLSIAYVS